MKSFLIFILFSIFSYTLGLKTSQICSINSAVDTGCESDQYSYRCSDQYCATSEKLCQELIGLRNYISSIKTNSKKDKFEKLVKSIKKCHTKDTLILQDICLRSFSCSDIHRMENLQERVLVDIKIPSYCPCNYQTQKYTCDAKHCSTNKETCQEFISSKKDKNNIKKCGNSQSKLLLSSLRYYISRAHLIFTSVYRKIFYPSLNPFIVR